MILSCCCIDACAPTMVDMSRGSPCLIAFTSGDAAFHEAVEDVFLDQRAGRQVQTLALVESEEDEAFDGLCRGRRHPPPSHPRKDVRRLAAQFQREGKRAATAPSATRLPVAVDPVKGDLGDAARTNQRIACLGAKAVDDVQNTRRQEVGDQLDQHHDRRPGSVQPVSARCSYQRPAPGPASTLHQDREVPRDDLADDAKRFVK